MNIKLSESFVKRLENQVDYISKDDVNTAKKFSKELISSLKEISKRPLSFRKSIYFDDESIRELIFKGYCIVFKIEETQIIVFGLVKYQNSISDKEE